MIRRILTALVTALVLAVGVLAQAPAASASPVPARAAQTTTSAVPAAAPQAPADIPWGDSLCRAGVGVFQQKGIPIPKELLCTEQGRKVTKVAAKAAYRELWDSIVGPFAKAAKDFVADMIKGGLSWWLTTPSVQVLDTGLFGDSDGKNKGDPMADAGLHAIMLGIGQMIAVMLLFLQAIRTILRRKGGPLADAFKGLAINALLAAVGLVVLDSLLLASDKLTESILDAGFGSDGDVIKTATEILLPSLGNPVAILGIALVVLIIGVVQLVMLFLRQAAIPLMAMLLPIAGSGQIGGESTRQWLPRLCTMILTIVCYKPGAALIIAVGFVEVKGAPTLVDWLRGVMTLALSIVALPTMMKLFAPLGLTMANSVSSGGGFAGALSAAGGVASLAGNLSRGTSATEHARYMDSSGPSSRGGKGGGVPSQDGGPDAGSAVQQSKSGSPAPAESAGTGGKGAQTAGTSRAAGGHAAIAIVAAETAHKGVQSAGNAASGGDQQ